MLQVSVNWLLCENSAAERLYPRVETGAPTEQLGRAVLAAYHARKAHLSGAASSVVLQLCNSASQLLQQSLTVDVCHKTDPKLQASSISVVCTPAKQQQFFCSPTVKINNLKCCEPNKFPLSLLFKRQLKLHSSIVSSNGQPFLFLS